MIQIDKEARLLNNRDMCHLYPDYIEYVNLKVASVQLYVRKWVDLKARPSRDDGRLAPLLLTGLAFESVVSPTYQPIIFAP